MSNNHIHPIHSLSVSRAERENLLNQKAKVIWFTGLSGSGKSTIALSLEKKLFAMGYHVYLLDGDNVRTRLCNNLDFSESDRIENIRRIAEVSKLFVDAGIICINSFISPTRTIRDLAKSIIGEDDFNEVYVNTPLAICEARDVKGLYKKARSGEIKNFTGIDSPYEAPLNPDLEVLTENISVEAAVNFIIENLF